MGLNIIFSYPLRDGDCPLRPSPLIPKPDPKMVPLLADLQDPSTLLNLNPSRMESLLDQQGPRLNQTLVEGGTNLLKDQAHCPFRAFFHHRLQAQRFAEPVPGIAPMARGDLVHLTLELLWKQLQNQTNLLTLNQQQRVELVQAQVEVAFARYFEHKSAPSEQLLQLEAERLITLVQEWLVTVEMERDFFQVLETEQQHVEKLGPLQIRLKVDRIDQLADGSRIVIDYKTGVDLHAEDFLSKPLIEPQLPIYAVADADFKADGVVFAKLRRGECKFIGVVKEKGLLGKVRELAAYPQSLQLGITDWDDLLVFWRQQLEQLAEDFVAGEAAVHPYDLKKSCQYCDLSGICRIQECSTVSGNKS